jgi:hypothetical protein
LGARRGKINHTYRIGSWVDLVHVSTAQPVKIREMKISSAVVESRATPDYSGIVPSKGTARAKLLPNVIENGHVAIKLVSPMKVRSSITCNIKPSVSKI